MKTHPVYTKYQVGKNGHVYSEGKRLSAGRSTNGYMQVAVSHKGKMLSRKVHRLVLETYVSMRPDGLECSHKNGVRQDNRLCNLEWKTPKENAAERKRHGTHQVGEQASGAKLSAHKVRMIFLLRKKGKKQREIAALFAVDQSTISSVLNGHTWKTVRDDKGRLQVWQPKKKAA